MSDQRPEWMPSENSISTLACNCDIRLPVKPEDALSYVGDVIYRTGLRAQIAAFKWLREDAGDMMTNALSDWLQSREEALRKELGE